METTDIILEELRSLRSDYNNHARETGERLSKLEAQMYSLVGNGQPGRIAAIEATVSTLQEWRWWLIGVSAGISGVVSVGVWVLEQLKR